MHFLCNPNTTQISNPHLKPNTIGWISLSLGFVSSTMACLSTRPTITNNGLMTALPSPAVAITPYLPLLFFFIFLFLIYFYFFSSCFSYLQLKLILYFILLFNINFSILVDIMGWFCFSCEKSLICAWVYKVGFWPLGYY